MTRKIFHIILLAVIAVACTEKVNLKLDSTYTRLVVDGNVASDSGIYAVALTTSADYFSNAPLPRVVNAAVTLTDGARMFTLHESQPGVSGIYQTDPGFAGQIGKSYTLHISLHDPIGGISSAEATSELPPVPRLDSVAANLETTASRPKGRWIIKLWAQDPGNEANFYLFNLYKNGKLMTDTINKKAISDDKFYNGSYMNGVPVMRLNNDNSWEALKPGDTITLQMSGITKQYYNFIQEVDLSGLNIPFFTGPPANIKGNVSNGGIGFFAAWSNSFKSAVVK